MIRVSVTGTGARVTYYYRTAFALITPFSVINCTDKTVCSCSITNINNDLSADKPRDALMALHHGERVWTLSVKTCDRAKLATLCVESRQKSTSGHHETTIAQLCRAISLQPRHISTIGKKLVKQHYVLQMSPQ